MKRPLQLRRTLLALATAACAVACAAGDASTGTGFSSFGGPGGGSAAGMAESSSSGGSSDGAATGDAGSDATGSLPSSESDDTAAVDEAGDFATTTGMDSGLESTDDGMASVGMSTGNDDGGVPGSQPTMGMYAHCVEGDFTNCGNADTCIYLGANGFCSVQGCSNAAVDCDPAPPGTAVTAICADAVTTALCALDCSTNPCPTGMVCTTTSINMGPTYDLCI